MTTTVWMAPVLHRLRRAKPDDGSADSNHVVCHFATGSGLLSIRWIRLAVSTERASLATSLSASRKIR